MCLHVGVPELCGKSHRPRSVRQLSTAGGTFNLCPLGRVDVPPELIDSVISTIGSNFSNLRSLHLRLHNFDIDVTTPASLLFDNLYELNLQFVSGNVDAPFKKFIQLGWSSVRFLTIQYASITEDAVRAIHENMPQLKKLVLHAIEFRCDHLAKR